MPNTHDTAYPRLKNSFSPQELTAVFTPTAEEFALAHQLAHSTRLRICFLALLKTFQRLGYFLPLRKIPRQVTEHISLIYGVHYEAVEWAADDASGSRVRHTALIRKHFGVRPFDESGKQTLAHSVRQAALLKDDTADIINVAVEELVRQRYELPGFYTLMEEAQRGKAEVNRGFYDRVCQRLGAEKCRSIDELLEADYPRQKSLWHSLKLDPGAPTLKQLRALVERLRWLKSLSLAGDDLFVGVPPDKVLYFAREARSLEAARMLEMEGQKRYTLAAALVRRQLAWCPDDLGEMIVKRIRKAHLGRRAPGRKPF